MRLKLHSLEQGSLGPMRETRLLSASNAEIGLQHFFHTKVIKKIWAIEIAEFIETSQITVTCGSSAFPSFLVGETNCKIDPIGTNLTDLPPP